jgi:predicted ATPase
LDALSTLPESPERDRRELAFQVAIGTPLIAVHGYSASQTGAAYRRARALCERLGEVEPLVAALSGEFVYNFVRGDFPMMSHMIEEAQEVLERFPNPMVRLAKHRLTGVAAMYSGAFAQARCEFNEILRSYDVRQHRPRPVYYVHDPKISALSYLALVLWVLGFPDQARDANVAAFHYAQELDQANLTAHVHNFAGAGLAELLGDVASVQAHADAIIKLADQHSLGYWRTNGQILQGWVMVQQGMTGSGLSLMRESIENRAALGVSWYQARYLSMLAAAYAQTGQAEPGLRIAAKAKDLIANNGEHMWEGELARIEGELMRLLGESTQQTEARFALSMAIARAQGAKSLELRAACSLARLWSDQGRRGEAHALLSETFGWFTEGRETADLVAAKALLDELT